MEDRAGVDSREFLRVGIRLPVLYRFFEGGEGFGSPREGITENLSVGGLLVQGRLPDEDLLAKAVTGAAPAALEFPLPDGYPEPVRAIARVVWVARAPEGEGECRMGLRFHEIPARDRDRIVEFVIRQFV